MTVLLNYFSKCEKNSLNIESAIFLRKSVKFTVLGRWRYWLSLIEYGWYPRNQTPAERCRFWSFCSKKAVVGCLQKRAWQFRRLQESPRTKTPHPSLPQPRIFTTPASDPVPCTDTLSQKLDGHSHSNLLGVFDVWLELASDSKHQLVEVSLTSSVFELEHTV